MKTIQLKTAISEARQSFELSLPLIASNLVRAASGFIGTLMVAHLGKISLDGMALGASTFFTLIVFFFGILNSIGVLVSQNFGANNKNGISLAVSQGFILAILVSVPMYLIVIMSPVVFRFTSENPEIVKTAIIYLHTISIAILPFSFLIVMNQFLVGMSKTRVVLFISLIQVPFELLFTYVFVFGKFGFPQFGIAGVGYAFALVFTMAASSIAFYISKSKFREFKIFANFGRVKKECLFELMKIGWPIGCMAVIEVALFATMTFFMGGIGTDQLAAFQIASQYIGPSIMLIFALSQVATIRVGQAVGRNDMDAVKRAAYVNMVIGAAFVLVIWLLFNAFARKLIGIDIDISKNQMVFYYAKIFFIFALVDQIFDNFRLITVGALRGLKDTKKPMFISLISFWMIAFPLGYLLAFILNLKAYGIQIAIVVGIISGFVMQFLRLRRVLATADLKKIAKFDETKNS